MGIVLCAAGTTVGVMVASSNAIFGFSELKGSGVPLFTFITLPLGMLAGIAAYGVRIQLDRIPEDTDDIDFKALLTRAFKTRGFVSAIVVSPIVFAGVYLIIKDQPDLILSHLIAFENGFFWQAVLGNRDRINRNYLSSNSR